MTQFLRSYLFAYVAVLGLALGCLGLLLLHSLVGGQWGNVSRRALQAGSGTLPWLAVLFIPILFGLRRVYPWMDAAVLATEAYSAGHKRIYFYVPFFILRAALYFSLWSWMEYSQRRSDKNAGAQLFLYVLTVSFASFDWVMSLEPQWSSSIYGVMLMVGDVLSALAFVVLILNGRAKAKNSYEGISEDTVHDLGNLMLAFVMLWAYMSLSQYLIIWSGNLPEEIGWYLARQRGGWQGVAILLILFQFTLPFFLLLARERKRRLASLARVAGGILALRVIDVFWLTAPDFSPGHFSVHLFDLLAPAALGLIWLWAFRGRFEQEEAA